MSAAAAAPALRLSGIERRFGSKLAVDVADLSIADGEMVCVVGPSGCGKTTLLRLIGGYLAADRGRIEVAGVAVDTLPLERRNVGMVFQSYALFPHLSATANVAFGLRARGVPKAERERRANTMLERVGLDAAARGRLPRALSGGEQQRVALARALVIEPRLLLLDEPLASLDRRLREAMRQELRALHQRTGVATVLVTHDQEDALFLADRIGVMAHGRLLQVGTPAEVYQRPALPFVARFLGDANFLTNAGAFAPLLAPLQPLPADACVLVRPEACRLSLQPQAHSARGIVRTATFMGADRLLEVELAPDQRVLVRARPDQLPASSPLGAGSAVHLSIAPESAWMLPHRDPAAWSAA